MDVLAEPCADGFDIAAAQRVVLGAELCLHALPQLRGDEAAERVAREVAEGARRPVDVLQHAVGVVGDLDAEQPPHAVVPRRRQVGDGERALDQRALELEAHHDVQRVGELVGLDADERRAHAHDQGVQRLRVDGDAAEREFARR